MCAAFGNQVEEACLAQGIKAVVERLSTKARDHASGEQAPGVFADIGEHREGNVDNAVLIDGQRDRESASPVGRNVDKLAYGKVGRRVDFNAVQALRGLI